jgi:hypothetical protein
MNGRRAAILREVYRSMYLVNFDRGRRPGGQICNLRRGLKKFWTEHKRVPDSREELLEYVGNPGVA